MMSADGVAALVVALVEEDMSARRLAERTRRIVRMTYTDFYGHGSLRHSEDRGKDERSKVI
jgi:hypothetical protein